MEYKNKLIIFARQSIYRMPHFIDTHTHLYEKEFSEDFRETVGRAIASGVTKMVFPDIDSSSREAMLTCASIYPENIFCGTGLHPTSVKEDWKDELDLVGGLLTQRCGWVAVGEIGMDLYWSKDFIDGQREAFDAQLSWAEQYGLPVIIHSREATAEIFDILETHKGRGLRGVFHAFGGSIETFRRFDRYGDFFVGIGGTLTYRNSKLPDTLAGIDISRIILETDSPYLTPVPHRGERNESSYIPIIAGRLAEIKGMPADMIAAQTTCNAESLFFDGIHKTAAAS